MPEADARRQQFSRDRAAKRLGVLVCVRCGSAAVDHRSLTVIACTSCDAEAALDGRAFAVIRQSSVEADLAVAFDEARQQWQSGPQPQREPAP